MRIASRAKRTERLFHGAEQVGAYQLPPDIVEAKTLADAAAAIPPAPRPPTKDAVWRKLVDDATDAFLRGSTTRLPDASPLETNRVDLVQWEHGERLRAEVVSALEERLNTMVIAAADDIITAALQPALAQVVATVEASARVLPDDPTITDAVVLIAKTDIRKAWIAATEAAKTHSAIMAAAEALRPPSEVDAAGEFSWCSNLDDVWPRPAHRNLPAATKAPWPVEQPQRLLWLIRHGARLIVPTAAEQDQLWKAKYRERVAQTAINRHNLEGFRAIFAG